MSTEVSQVVIAARRQPKAKPTKAKVTVDMSPQDAALLRLVSRDWNLALGDALGMAMRCFVAAGWADRDELTVSEVGAQRIRDAVARWEATKNQPVLDPSVHAGPTAQSAAPEESPRHPHFLR